MSVQHSGIRSCPPSGAGGWNMEPERMELVMSEKYVAYVGTYTHGSSIGIHLYDVDVEEGTLTERKVCTGQQLFPYLPFTEWKISVFHRG